MRKPVSSPVGTGAARLGRGSDESTSRTALPSSLSPVPKPRKANKAAKQREKHERKYGTPEFQAHLHATPCLHCVGQSTVHQAHFGKHPMGKKNDWTATGPLCRLCHDALDRRTSRHYWFTPAQRELLSSRQAAFIADWLASSPQQDDAQ